MRLSIIVPVYNVKNYIRECLDSIAAAMSMSSEAVEVIVIDDGSTDGCSQIVDEYKTLEWFNVIHQENAGVAAARNKGLYAATGDWVWFVDSDDWIDESAIEYIIQAVESYHEADCILFDGYEDVNGRERVWEHFEEEKVLISHKELSALWRGSLYYPSCTDTLGDTNRSLAAPWDKVYRREFLIGNNLRFCEALKVLDDMVFNMEVFGAATQVAYVKKPIYHYRIVNTSITHSYKHNRLDMDIAVWEYIEDYLHSAAVASKGSEGCGISDGSVKAEVSGVLAEAVEAMHKALYLRIVKSYGICCMQQFFNEANSMSLKSRIALAQSALQLPIYRQAFDSADTVMADIRLRMLIYCGRRQSGIGMWLLSVLQKLSNRISQSRAVS